MWHLTAADTMFCDGIFYTCHSLFHQLCTIHVMIDGSMYPLVFGLLPPDQLYTFLQPHQRPDQRVEHSSTTIDGIHRLRDYHKQRDHYRFPMDDHQMGISFTTHNASGTRLKSVDLQIADKENYDITKMVRRAALLPLIPQNQVDSTTLYIKTNKIVILLSNKRKISLICNTHFS